MRTIERDGLVAEFVRSYGARYGRRKLLTEPVHLHELERTIGREALFVAIVEIRRLLPRVFASGPGGTLRPDEATLCDAFYVEFLASLERALEWPPADAATEAASFRRDLEMYRQWSNRSEAPSRAAESPFPDRCAILLDPAMMDQARRAGASFEVDIARATARILGRLGRTTTYAVRKSLRKPKPQKQRLPAKKKTNKKTSAKKNAKKSTKKSTKKRSEPRVRAAQRGKKAAHRIRRSRRTLKNTTRRPRRPRR